jgi:hypothetical protein
MDIDDHDGLRQNRVVEVVILHQRQAGAQSGGDELTFGWQKGGFSERRVPTLSIPACVGLRW